mmetsp:Transcript_7135/g.28055  ORF Transcript_7135/g.28055 Transcript_7135/m.28055 type:complete len:313 (+) Transcript_7135:3554-4492(+)
MRQEIRRLALVHRAAKRLGLAGHGVVGLAAGIQLHAGAVARAHVDAAVVVLHLPGRHRTGSEARVVHERHTRVDDAPVRDVGAPANAHGKRAGAVGGKDHAPRAPDDVVTDVNEVVHAVSHEHARSGPEHPLPNLCTQHPVHYGGVLVMLPQHGERAPEVTLREELVHEPPAGELPLPRDVGTGQRPGLELAHDDPLHQHDPDELQERAKDVVAHPRGKDDAEAEGVHKPGDAVLPCHTVECREQRVAVVERVNDGAAGHGHPALLVGNLLAVRGVVENLRLIIHDGLRSVRGRLEARAGIVLVRTRGGGGG